MRTAVIVVVMLVPLTSFGELSVKKFTYDAKTATYDVEVCGTAGTTVGVYYDRSAPPTPANAPDLTGAVTLGATDSCVPVKLVRPNDPVGLYRSYAFVDPQNLVAEINEQDNVAGPIEVCVGPDVYIESFKVEPTGAAVSYVCNVCNGGSQDARKFRVGFWHDRASAPAATDMGNVFKAITNLAPGECSEVQVPGGLRPNGSFTAWARADSGDFVTECREGNNFRGPVGYTLSNPDLLVDSFEAAVSGSTITYTVKVCNRGTASVAKFFTDIYYHRPTQIPSISDPGDEAKAIQGLAADACATLSFVRRAAPKGTFDSYALADPDDFVSEPNEGNNLSSRLSVVVSDGSSSSDGGAESCVDHDGDGAGVGPGCTGVPDCNDNDPSIAPGKPEICGDKIDQDCDLTPDDGCPGVDCKDGDGDSFGVGKDCVLQDCDDTNKDVFPWAKERCGDNKDDNCNGIADDGCPGRQCVDHDADGFGVGRGCPGPQDCDNNNFDVKPFGKEVCGNGIDDDCDSVADDGCSTVTDNDQDGVGVGGGVKGQPDCDDQNGRIGPNQKEICGDGIDNDCDGTVDDGCPGVDCKDGDGDGWGVGKDCKIPDCDDTKATVHPWGIEVCGDQLDNDCDGTVDDNCPGVACVDQDLDSWGVGADCCKGAPAAVNCRPDCDDKDGGKSPWVREICADGIDNDCDGAVDEGCPVCEDADRDGYGIGPKCTNWDCNDTDPKVHPGATELCNGVDDNCDGVVDEGCTKDSGCSCDLRGAAARAPTGVTCCGGLLVCGLLLALLLLARRP